MSLDEICGNLRELQVMRRNCIRMQTRISNNLGAMARRQLGWRADMTEKERNQIAKQAATLVTAMTREDETPVGLEPIRMVSSLGPFVAAANAGSSPYDKLRKTTEKEMRRLSMETPGAALVECTRGFGDLGLAVIVGEAGNLAAYSNPSKLWKRLGLAPPETYKAGENGARMVPRRIKAEIFACVGDPLLKNNKEVYRKEYDARKEAYLAAGRTKSHAHLSAMRVMEKKLLCDLWVTWHGAPALEKHET